MKTASFFDAVVVGAGPAGSVAAYEIARAGFSVLLVEKHAVIGVPVCCAEGITHEGLTSVVPLDRSWIAADISELLLVSPGGVTLELTHPDAGYILNRKVFDRDLAVRAAEAGATVRVSTEAVGLESSTGHFFDGVQLRRNGEAYAVGCRVVIGCDGIESLVGRWAGLDTTITPDAMDSAAQYLLGDLQNFNHRRMVFYFSEESTPGGYAWIFPKGPTTANVGLGFTPSLNNGKSALARLDGFVREHFGSASRLERMAGAVPAYHGRNFLLEKNVLLAGDAARLVDSLTGAGIANALLSGRDAGQIAAEYLGEKQPQLSILRKYPERFLKQKGRNLRYAHFARRIFMRMSDGELDEAIDFLRPMFDGKTFHHINAVEVIKSLLRGKPSLLKLARHLVSP